MKSKKYKLIIFDVSGTLADGYGRLYPNVKESLEAIHKNGMQIALATNLSQRGLEEFVAEYNFQGLVVNYKSAQSTAYKPSPVMLDEIMLEEGIEVTECLMVGDTSGDIHMAHNAKMHSCLIGWNGNFSVDALSANPHEKVESLDELVNSLV